MSTRTARLIPLTGGCNFRDLGGYRTRDGRQTAWGKIFRTGVLTYLTADDHAQLAPLGVRSICDLRRADERTREPTRWQGSVENVSWDDGGSPPTIRTIAAKHPNTAAGMRAAMIDLYRALPDWMAPRLKGMFDRIDNGDVPLIVHCAAGKDRTGIAIALLLAVLDVPHDVIVEDYLLTNHAGDFEQFILAQQHAQLGLAVNAHPLMELAADVRRVLFAADADYLLGAFERIERDYGDVAQFLDKALGIDAAKRERLRARLLI